MPKYCLIYNPRKEPKLKTFLIAIITLGAVACTSALYKESIQDAQDATQANLRAYQLSPVDEAGVGRGSRAFNKSAYCLTVAILRNEKQPLPEGGLPCPTK
jgi:hypothetical protein